MKSQMLQFLASELSSYITGQDIIVDGGMTNSKDIKDLAKQYRKNILFAAYSAGAKSAHIGGALSIVEILACLYGALMNLDPNNPLDYDRDRLILSKGHACLALYSALAEKDFFKDKNLKILRNLRVFY